VTEDKNLVEEGSDEAGEDDTEGHSLATYEYGRLVSRERSQEAERHAREARMRDSDRGKKR
jgi:hypothetical protein